MTLKVNTKHKTAYGLFYDKCDAWRYTSPPTKKRKVQNKQTLQPLLG